jgi:hypothetical protein
MNHNYNCTYLSHLLSSPLSLPYLDTGGSRITIYESHRIIREFDQIYRFLIADKTKGKYEDVESEGVWVLAVLSQLSRASWKARNVAPGFLISSTLEHLQQKKQNGRGGKVLN